MTTEALLEMPAKLNKWVSEVRLLLLPVDKDGASRSDGILDPLNSWLEMPNDILEGHIEDIYHVVLKLLNTVSQFLTLNLKLTPGKKGLKPAATCKMCVIP